MGGSKRLAYALNPLMACGSPLLAGRVVARLTDLLPALEQAAGRADRRRAPVDGHIAAFTAARADTTLMADVGYLDGFASPSEKLAVLRLFARLQARLHPAPLPALAGWLLESGVVDLDQWLNLNTRKRLARALAEAAGAGQVTNMLKLAQDESARTTDRDGAAQAATRVVAITQELALLAAAAPRRRADAERLAYEIAAAAGILALLGAAVTLGMSV
jgi:hypothetical protein